MALDTHNALGYNLIYPEVGLALKADTCINDPLWWPARRPILFCWPTWEHVLATPEARKKVSGKKIREEKGDKINWMGPVIKMQTRRNS